MKVTDDNSAEPAKSGTNWLEEIRRLYALGKSRTFELACVVYVARESMARGQWAKLWRSKQVPFSRTRGCMLRRIGERFGIPNVQTFEHLPGEWSILYELSRLDMPTIQKFLAQGQIHRAMTLAEAKNLVRGALGLHMSPPRLAIQKRFRSFRTWVYDNVGLMTDADRDCLIASLRDLAVELMMDRSARSTAARFNGVVQLPINGVASNAAALFTSAL